MRLYAVRSRHYQVIFGGPQDAISSASTNDYFDSFKRN